MKEFQRMNNSNEPSTPSDLELIQRLSEDLQMYYDTLENLPQSYDNGHIIAENLSILIGILPSLGNKVAKAESLKNVQFSLSDKKLFGEDKEYYKLSVKSSTNHQQNISGYNGTQTYIELFHQYKNLYSDVGTMIESTRSLLKNVQFEIEHNISPTQSRKYNNNLQDNN